MESEKVKEIKKALEEQTQHKPINCSNSEYVEACGMYCKYYRKFVADMGSKNGQTCKDCNKFTATDEVKEYADILTLINELESENEWLVGKVEEKINEMTTYIVNNQKLKDRITKLEKENQKYHEVATDCQKIAFMGGVCDTKLALKQFAERLKEKAVDWDCETVNCIINDIDDTLKEFQGK